MPPTTLDRIRLSLLWSESFFNLLAAPQPPDAPMAFLGRASTFAARFAALPAAGSPSKDLTAPWPKPSGHFFWTYYLEGKRPGDLTGERAWRLAVPFRAPVPARLSMGDPDLRAALEAFYYPYGIALVATVAINSTDVVEDTVQRVFELRRSRKVDVVWDPSTGRSNEQLTLTQFAGKALALLRARAVGAATTPAVQSVEPFSIVTVIRASGVNADESVAEGGAVHRMLDAMASWRPGWKANKLPALEQAAITTRQGAPDVDVLYARPRGRVVWFGRLLAEPKEGGHALSCYHRNLTFLSLQVEALGNFLQATAAELDGPGALSAAHFDCAKRAAGLIGRLYGGQKDVYRSWSPRRHVDENELVAPINKVRDVFGWPALA